MPESSREPAFTNRRDERCEDCEINGHLTDVGLPLKGSRRSHCKCKGRGRIRLVTHEQVRAQQKLAELVVAGLARVVSRKELLDPYAIPKRG